MFVKLFLQFKMCLVLNMEKSLTWESPYLGKTVFILRRGSRNLLWWLLDNPWIDCMCLLSDHVCCTTITFNIGNYVPNLISLLVFRFNNVSVCCRNASWQWLICHEGICRSYDTINTTFRLRFPAINQHLSISLHFGSIVNQDLNWSQNNSLTIRA